MLKGVFRYLMDLGFIISNVNGHIIGAMNPKINKKSVVLMFQWALIQLIFIAPLYSQMCYNVSNLSKGVCFRITSPLCAASPANNTLLTDDFFGTHYADNGTTSGGTGGTFPTNIVGYAPRTGAPSVINDDNGSGTNNLMLESNEALEFRFNGVAGVTYTIGGIIRTVNGGTANIKYSIYDSTGVELSSTILTGSSTKNGGGSGWNSFTKNITVPSCGRYFYVISHNGGSGVRIGQIVLRVASGGGTAATTSIRNYTMQPNGTYTSAGNPTYATQAAMVAAGGVSISCGLGFVANGLYQNTSGNTWYDPNGILITDSSVLASLINAKTNNLLSSTPCPMDSDGDGLTDNIDIDDDNDAILDSVEKNCELIKNGTFDGNYNNWQIIGRLPNLTYFANIGNRFPFNSGDTLPGGSIAQTINTTKGIPYRISFTGSHNATTVSSNIVGVLLEVTDSANNIIGSTSFTRTATTTYTPLTYTLDFLPTSTTTKITFKDISTQSLGVDPTVDDISIEMCDTDGDGIPNHLDLDSDNDGCSDAYEGGSTTNKTDSIIAGPYGTNGLANSKETAADNGVINYNLTYNFAVDSAISACLDTDGDGIANNIDIDDDNDGIPDAIEDNCAPLLPATNSLPRAEQAVPTGWSIVQSSPDIADVTTHVYGVWNTGCVGVAPAPPNGHTRWVFVGAPTGEAFKTTVNGLVPGQQYTFTYYCSRFSIGVVGQHTLKMGATIIDQFTPTSGCGWVTRVVSFTPTASSHDFTFQGAGSTGSSNISVSENAISKLFCDFDNDGIPNSLDLDSDNDGCSDAFEGGATTNKTDSIIAGPYGTNGLANSKETTADNGVINYNLTYEFAVNTDLSLCRDSDNDGVVDINDIDDDNDGIMDHEESPNCFLNPTEWHIINKNHLVNISSNLVSILPFNNYKKLLDSFNNLDAIQFSTTPAQNQLNTSIFTATFINPVELNALYIMKASATQILGGNVIIQGSNNNSTWIDLSAPINPLNASNITENGGITLANSNKFTITQNKNAYKYYRIFGSVSANILAGIAREMYFDVNPLKYNASYFPRLEKCFDDTDGDGKPNHLDLDSDGDGCSDAYEGGSTTNKTDSIIAGPYGTNGLANSKETATDNGVINYNLTYGLAINNLVKSCLDTDNDGIADYIDIDDDNDGVLDITEQGCNSTTGVTIVPIGINATAVATTSTINDYNPIITSHFIINLTSGPTNPPIYDTYAFANTLVNPIIAFSDVDYARQEWFDENDNPLTLLPLDVSPATVVSGNAITRTNLTIPGGTPTVSAYGRAQVLGSFKKLKVKYVWAWTTSNNDAHYLSFVQPNSCNVGLDTDGDGIPNHLDLDSDNDGCSDAFESGATSLLSANYKFPAPYGANGLANSKETAVDNGIINYTSSYDTFALNSTIKACLDTDGDGIRNIDDIDDDNDGILDVKENCFMSDPSIAATYTRTTGNYALVNGTVNNTKRGTVQITSSAVSGTSGVYGTPNRDIATGDCAGNASADLGVRDVTFSTPVTNAIFLNEGFEFADEYQDIEILAPYSGTPEFKILSNHLNCTLTKISSTRYRIRSGASCGVYANCPSSMVIQISGAFYSKIRLTGDGPTTNSSCRYIKIGLDDAATDACDLDMDNDGIPNELDLDSDGDGCSDAVEAGTTFISTSGIATANQLTATIIPAPYGTNGFANGLETVADNGTYKGTYSYSFATNAAVKACTDSDKDGLVDVYDLDDDNDGILDEVECASQICSSPILNGSFESNPIAANTYSLVDASTVSGWKTTSTDNLIELWGTGNASVPAANGVVFAEITASQSSSILYQKLCVTPGSVIEWSVKHRGRAGVEVAELQIGASLTSLVTQKSMSDGTTAWGTHTGSYTIPSTQQETYIAFKVISPLNGSGNLIDDLIVVIKSAGECSVDSDNDGIPNRLDLDSDNDGCSDAFEAGSTSNLNDSIINGPYGTNGLANSKETLTDNGIINYTLTYNRAINSSIKPCVKPDISGNIKSHCQKPGIYQVFAIPNPTNSGATLNWYSVPTAGTASSTAPSVNTANVGVYTFWVSQTLNGVESVREEVQITVAIAPATPGAISGPTSITQGSVSLHNIASVAGATSYVWTLPNGWSGTSTTSTIIDTAGSTGGFITVKASNNGCESAAASLQVFVSPKPPKPTISIDSFSYCQGDTASQLSATPTPANSGGILNWYTVPAGGTASSVAPTPNTNTSGIFTFFVSQTVNNIESDRAPIFVRVNAKPAQPVQINGPANIQANNSYTYSVTAIPGATSYTWTLPNGWSGTSTTNSITINSNTTTTGTLKVKANADSCSSAEQTLIINTLPVKPDLSDNTNLSGDSILYCQGATATQLQAKTNPVNNGGTIKWYTQATGGSALATAPTPSTTLAGTMTYYVSQTVNNIESERTAIRVIVKPTLSQPTTIQGATAVQANTSQTFSVTLVPGATSYTWTLPNGWTGTSTTNSITINTNTTTSGIVSVTANVNGCSSTAQTLTVGNLPTKPDLSDNTNLSGDSIVYCQGATATQLQAKTNPANNGGTIKWYTQATGGSALASAPTPSTTLAGTTTYYVSQTVNNIESERTAIRVIVKPTLSQPTAIQGATAVQANTSQTYSVTAVPGATSYTWSLPNGWTGTSTTNSITINTNTTTSGIVSVTANVNGCSSTAQTLTVGSLPTKPDLSDNTNLSGDSIVYCQGATATQLQAKTNPSNNGGTIKWYTQATGGTALTTAPTPNTTFSSLTTYYVSQTVNGIESERTPIRVIVRPTPSQPNSIQGNTTVVASTSNTYSVNAVSGATGYTWTLPGGWSGTSTTNSIVVTSGTTGGTIRVVAHVGPCSSAEQTLLVNIQGGGPNIDDNKNIVGNTIKYCVGAKADPLVAKATVANAILVWYTQPIGGSPSVMAPTPNTTSVDTQRYYVSQIANGQESLRTQIVVIVTDQNCPIPCMNNLVPDIAPLFITNICPDTTADLTSIETKNQPNGSVLRWFTSLPASEQTRVLNPSQVKTGTYYAVFYNPTDSCYSLNGDTATKVQVITSSCTNCNAGHVAPKLSTIGLSNICPSTTADLTLVTASNQPKGTTLEWHTSVPVSSATKVANPKSVTVGIYYAVFFDATNNCYSKSGTLTTPLVVSITSCPNPCQAGPIAPKVSQEVLTNICPSTTANLTTITASNTPSGTVLQWHTGVPATSFNKVTNPSAVLGGTYYAVFFDATHNCYSGNGFGMYAVDVVITNCPNTCQAGTTKPSLSVNSLDNACPKTTVDLTSVTASNRPAGTVLQWYTEMPATASNRVTTPSAVGAGTYYAIFYDTLNKCYTTQGYGSTPILVNITNCPNPCNSGNFAPEIIGSDVITNTCPSTTVNLNQFQVLNQPAGTTLVWHSKLPASSLNRIANPATYNVSGKVYGLYFDSKNNCYSQGGQFGLEIQVILTSCPDTCRSGKETPKTSGSDELTNICPSLTTNLTNVIITNKPTSGSVVVQWHTALPATALNRIKTPSSVNSGVYYAVFYDTLQKCYSLLGQDGMQVNVTNTTCPKCLSPNQAPSFGLDSIGTDCPSTTANLNTISVNNKPKGVVVRWYTSPQILSSNVVSNPSAVGAGMYYATFYDTANNCFANNGAGLFTPIKVSLTVCCNSGYQAPKLSAKELTNLCPDSMADLTRISATNQPTGVVLEWHTKTPAQSSTKVSNPYAVGPGIYYGVFYDVVNDCYTDGGIYTTPISVTRKACTTCNAGEAAPLLNTEGISNACPSTTADLTKITASNRPVGIVMEWHTSSTVTATSRVNNPSAVGAGTYYAIFYDPTNTCYAGNGQATTKIIVTISNCSSPCNAGTTAPALSQKTVTNVCPSTTANLSNISANNRPAGTNLQWHTALPATTSNRVVNPNAVSIGTYYALFYDPTNNCYSGNGYGAQQVEVVIRNCNSTNPCDTMQTSPVLKSDTAINTCPSLTVNLSTLENPSINGYVITWHKGTPATDANRLDSPQFAKAGTYYASYYDTARTCYSLLGKATKQVTVTTFNCPLCYAGSEAPRLSVSTLNNNCPTATADLTQITSFNLPKNTQLTWHTSVPANATNRIANPSAVSNAGTYYAVFFDATNNCYSGNGSAAASVTVTLLDCNNLCAAGTESPKLNISNGTLKNICPAVFANLTSVTASNKPTAGQVVLQWHTALPANATNRVILPSSVTSGTYYAIFYDTINKCYAGNGNQATQVVVSIENCTNTCIAGSQQPAFNTDILRNSCPNLTADLTLLVSKNQPKGTVIEWRMESGQVVANPKSVTSGRYVALFKDTVNNCYSTGTLNPLTVIQISCKEQVANNDYTQINNKKPGITVIDLSKNDTLTTGSKYSITPNGNPKRGTATIDPITGKLSYTITDTSFVGYDTITYQLCDTITNKCSTAYVIIALSNPKDTTVSNIDGKPEVIIPLDSVKGIPTKPVDAKGSYVIDTNPTNGTATIDSNGKLVYRPNAGACGKDSVKVSRIYSFSDGRPNEVYSYWVYIENPPCGPIAKNDYEQISNKKPGATVIDVSNNDIEPLSGSKYSIAPNGNPKRGTATIDPKTGKLSYTITDTSFVGYDTITYQLCDTITNKCSTAYVIIALSNPKDTTVSNIDGKPEVIIPLDSVTGIPIKPVDAKGSYVIDTNPTNGTATIDSNGKLVYRPNPGACGKDSVKVSRIYSFSDGRPNEVYSYWVYIENPPCDDEIPNYISPNGDGANDKFVLPASMRKKYPNLRLSIYNRWGNMVWRSNGVYQNNWGGEHYDASNLPDGVYYYIIELENQNEKARTGFIQVMRH